MLRSFSILLLFALLMAGCTNRTGVNRSTPVIKEKKVYRPSALERGKFFSMEGVPYLYGGKDSNAHFNISNLTLLDSQFHYGIGRELFDALIEPEFISEASADSIYADSSRVLLLTLGDEAKVYGIDLLTHHEIINDVVDGQYVAAAYCILADLGAVYSREMGDNHLTFALSGYTYYDPEVWNGLDGFIWWDRETESLWWPLTGKAVSGPLRDVPLRVLDETSWSQTSWGAVRGKYKNLQVLKPDQWMDAPVSWPALSQHNIDEIRNNGSGKTDIAPKWGDN